MEDVGTSLIIFLDQIESPNHPTDKAAAAVVEEGDDQDEGREVKGSADGSNSRSTPPTPPPPLTKEHLAAAPLLELRHRINEVLGLPTSVHAYLNGKGGTQTLDLYVMLRTRFELPYDYTSTINRMTPATPPKKKKIKTKNVHAGCDWVWLNCNF